MKPLPNRGQPVKQGPRLVKPSLVRPALSQQAVLNRASQQVRMATGGNLGPPSLEAFGNLSPRAQEILKKIYSGDNAPLDSKGSTAKSGSDSNLRKDSFGSGSSSMSMLSNSRTYDSRGFLKRNSLGSTPESLLPRSISLQDNFLSLFSTFQTLQNIYGELHMRRTVRRSKVLTCFFFCLPL